MPTFRLRSGQALAGQLRGEISARENAAIMGTLVSVGPPQKKIARRGTISQTDNAASGGRHLCPSGGHQDCSRELENERAMALAGKRAMRTKFSIAPWCQPGEEGDRSEQITSRCQGSRLRGIATSVHDQY